MLYYAVFQYITPYRPLARCAHIYNSMNYESLSFHHSWSSLPDVQITLRKTTITQTEPVHLNRESQPQSRLHGLL